MRRFEPPPGTHVVVVGGANTDVVGTSAGPLIDRDSNPGTVRESAGGVGRNIAENLARLGVRTSLVTAFGTDPASERLATSCRSSGIDVESSLFVEGAEGARYLAINSDRHDLALAVNDMRVLEELTVDVLAQRLPLLTSADLVVLDANLSQEAIAWIVSAVRGVPVVIDPVSAAKAPRVAGVLAQLAALKPNRHEAEVLLGTRVHGLEDAEKAARGFIERGVARAFVTPGPEGIAWAGPEGAGVIPSPGIRPVNTSGAGDAFTAGVVYGLLAGASTAEQATFASAISIIALSSEETVSPEVEREHVLAFAKELYG